MRKIIFVLFAVLIAGCNSDEKDIAIFRLKNSLDSLHNVSIQKEIKIDSLKFAIREQRILIKLTAIKCDRYAKIVKKDPTQSVFIVNWINRSFQWADEK